MQRAGGENFKSNSMGSGLGMGAWHIWEIKSSSKGVKSRVCVNEGVGRFSTRVLSSFLTKTHILTYSHSLSFCFNDSPSLPTRR